MKKKISSGYIFILPAVIWFIVFNAYPIFRSLQLSFYDAGVMHAEFIGFQNFVTVFTSERIMKGFVNSIKFTLVCAPILTFLPLIIAMLGFKMKNKLQVGIRFAFYLPSLTAGVIISIVWAWLLRPTGLINVITGTDIAWLGTNPFAFFSICLILICGDLGLAIIIYMAAMGSINSDLYDAAKLDGCTPFQEDRYITLPLIAPTIGFIFFIKIVAVAQIWQYPYLLTGGGINRATTTAVLEIYNQAFKFGKYGLASAIGVLFVIMVGIMAFVQKRFFRGEK